MKIVNLKLKIKRAFRWLTRTPRRKAAWVLLVAYLVNQFVYPLVPFLKDQTVHANGVIEPVTLGTSLFVNRNPDFNVWFGDRLDQSKHKIVFEVSGHEIEMRLQSATESSPSGEIDELIANLRKELQKPYLTTTNGNDSIDQKIGDKATIRYEILPNRGVKESIIISEVAPTNQYTFSLKLSSGVQLKSKLENLNDTKLNTENRTPSTEYHFEDSKGKYLAHFEPLVMTDAAGAKSNDIKMEISDKTLTITANETWLNSPDRVFPIDLDPTIVHDQNPDFSSGTENRTQINSTNAVESQFKELQSDINTVGLWHFNEGSGTTAYDASGNNNTGTLTNGPVWNGPTDTQIGLGKSSMKFDGVNDYVTIANSTTLDTPGDFTVESWFKWTSGSDKMIYTRRSTGAGQGIFIEVYSGNFYGAIRGSGNSDLQGTTTLQSGVWYHGAFVRQGTSLKLYLNGKEEASTTTSVTVAAAAQAANIGGESSGKYFNGLIDEVRISNVGRTPEEIAADASRFPYSVHESPVIDFGSTPNTLDSLNYTATGVQTGDGEKPYSRDGLIAQWNFNETSGTVAYNTAGSDSCGGTPSSCNGTLTSFASTSSQDQAAGTGWTANNKRWGAGALMFDGSDDYINVGDIATFDTTFANFTVSSWINPRVSSATFIAGKMGSAGQRGWQFQTNSNNTIVLDYFDSASGSEQIVTSTGTVALGQWSHVAAVFSASSYVDIYINGVLSIHQTSGVLAVVNGSNSASLQIGQRGNMEAGGYFPGGIDSTSIYSRALTATEILSNYQSANIEFQTRTGATSTPNDGTWEAWKTTSGTGDTQITSLDNPIDVATPSASIWQGAQVATSSSSLAIEGTASLRTKVGAPQVEQSVVALWHMDETSGTGAYIKDSTANANNGTPTGTTVVDGFYGKGRSFNGSSDYLTVGTTALIGNSTNNTVEAWVYPDVTSATYEIYTERNTTATNNYYQLRINANKIDFLYYDGSTYCQATGATTMSASNWYYVAGVRSGNNCYAYLNGVQDGSSSAAVGTLTIHTANIGVENASGTLRYYFDGIIDEVRLNNVTRTADEIAEGYRAGRDHRVSKVLISNDLSSKTKLPFYVASDRPGTFMEATVGESAYANYEPDANTVGLWHLEEQTGTANTYIKDSSGNGNNSTSITGTTNVQGKIGKTKSFDGTDDHIKAADSTSLRPANVTAEAWVKTSEATNNGIVDKNRSVSGGSGYLLSSGIGASGTGCSATTNIAHFAIIAGAAWYCAEGTTSINDNSWHYVVGTYDLSNVKIYVDGVLQKATSSTGAIEYTGNGEFGIGKYLSEGAGTTTVWNGLIDEVRVSNTARTPDEIRQAYEIGKRTHPITIDFKADLDSSNLITSTSDLSFAIQPDTDVTANSLNINKGEKIIVKENVNGTEYLAQGTVTGVTYESNTSNPNAWTQDASSQGSVTTVTVTAWDSGSTVPSGGFTTAATVFKWQREYMDLTQITQSTHRDAITRITMRVTDGSQGANVWLDDFESADYSDGSRVTIGSTANRYFQYRAILSTQPLAPSPTLTNVTINYNSGTTAQAPKVKDASSDFSATGTSLNRVTDTGSANSPSLELAYKELPKDINTWALWHMNEASGNLVDSSGNSNTGTVTGTTVATGKFGNGRTFSSGSSDYAIAASTFNYVTGITFETWLKTTVAATSYFYGDVSSTAGTQAWITASGTVSWLGYNAGSKFNPTTTKTVNDGSWHHVALTWDGTTNSNSVKIYIDGVLDVQATPSGTFTTAQCPMTLGSTKDTGCTANTSRFTGTLDETRVSVIVRTPEEIKLDAQRRPYGVYTSDVQNLGTKVSSIDNIRWTENGVQTGDGETPYSTNSLVAQWNFNETSGTTAAVTSTSSCGSTCNGTLTTFASTTSQDQAAGTGWTKDNRKWGNGALMFDGTNDYVSVPDFDDTGSSGQTISVFSWVKVSSAQSAKGIVAHYNNSTTGEWILATGHSNTVKMMASVFGGGNYKEYDSSITIVDGSWHYVGFTFNANTLKLYIDGVEDISPTKTVDQTVNSLNNVAQPVTIGSSIVNGSPTDYFNGIADSPSIYSRALTAPEILANYQAGNVELQTRTGTTTTPNDGTWEEWRPSGNSTEVQLDNLQTLSPVQKINSANLVGYWKLDEVSGNRADSAGSNTLTDNATVTSKAGHLNLGGQFTAANSEYLSITDNAAVSTGDIDYTLSTWVYLDSSHLGGIVSKDTGAGVREFMIVYSTNIFEFNAFNGSSAIGTVDWTGTPVVGTWYHIVAWHDSVGNTVNIQVNNGAVVSAATTGAPVDTAAAFKIGSDYDGRYFNGRIDETAMWKRVLTADERRILYEDGLDKTNDSVVGGINRTIDSTTKFEGTGSEKLSIGSPQVDSSTVALWHLDETSGSGAYIKDSTANANNGTPTGTSVVDGFYGKGRSFNGSSDYINTGTGSSLNFERTNAFSISAWFINNSSSGYTTIASKNQWNSPFAGYELSVNSSWEGLRLAIQDSSATYLTVGTGTSNLYNDGKWHHVVATYDGSSSVGGIKVYVDGANQTNTSRGTTLSNSIQTSEPFNIGARDNSGTFWNGKIDEVRVSSVARSADEIAEAYRAGRDHRISKTITATDMSNKTKLPFYYASDRPGTFMEATVGESAYANYEPDANTVGLWHLEEAAGAGAYIKDSSGSGNNGTPTGTTFVQGKIGKARSFNGTSDYISIPDNSALTPSTITIDAWINPTALPSSGAYKIIVDKRDDASGTAGYLFGLYNNGGTQQITLVVALTSPAVNYTLPLNTWSHVVVTQTGTTATFYVNGSSIGSAGSAAISNYANPLIIGKGQTAVNYFSGTLDEIRVSNTARTSDDIRQAYEIGKRTHQITNDFVTTPQAAYSSGTSVTVNNPYGTTNLTDTLSLGDTMIFKENVGGTETVSQGTVTGISNTSSTYGTVTLLAAPTFPSGGFTTNATVFKWQREFVDLTGSLPSQRDGSTRLTMRITDGSAGANIWIDDIKAAGPYLTQSTTRTASVTSTVRQYLQYRIIFSTTDPLVSPTVTSVSVQTHSSPVKVVGSDTLGADGSFDKDGNLHLGSNNVKKVAFYDRTKDQISYALDFDNSNDYVAVGTGPTSVKTVEFWVNPNSTSTEFIDLNGSAYINVASGTVTATGFTSPTIYVNGSASTTLSANQWSHIAVTTGTGLNATALNFGKRSTSYFNGVMDEVALYSSALTAAQVTTDYNIRRLAGTETGLVALYHFDEGQGTRAYDSVGGFHGTLTNMAATAWVNSQNDRDQSALSQQVLGVDPNWANGVARRSNGLSFNGTSSDYVTIANESNFDFERTNTFTLETWFKTSSAAVTNPLITKGNLWNPGYDLSIESGSLIFYVSATGAIGKATVNTYNDGLWHHVAATYDGSSNRTGISIYVDGVASSTTDKQSASITGSALNNLSLYIGYTNGWTSYFNGSIDESAIFNTARTAAQISADYNSRRFKGNETGLLGLWHFDEGEFNTCSGGTNDVCDATSGANDGAATGTTWVTDARAIQDNNARYVSLGNSTSANTDKGMEIYAISTTQFKYRWTGDQTWSSAVNFSSYPFATPAQLGTTGVYVGFDTTNGVFGDESYFLIPSWAIQQFSTTRGVRRSFPERSYLVATDRSVDIIDADDNTLWMRTSNGVTGNLLGTQTLNVPSGLSMNSGQLTVATNGTAGTGVYRLDFNRDVAYRYNGTNRTTGTNNLAKRNATDWSWGSADTGQNLIDSIVNDVSLLVINGKCVTGDTLLRRRRRKNGKWVYDDVRIDEVEIGDEILSLNEKTGKFEWQIVEAKKNMGVKDTWQIITESGKKIRATSDHKFLSSIAHARSGTFEVDQSNRIEDLARDTYIAVTGHGHTNITMVKSAIKREVFNKYYKNRSKLFGPMMWARVVNHLLIESQIQNAKIILDIEYSNYNKLIEQTVTNGVKNISVEFKSIGKESPAHIAVWTANRKARKTTGASGITQTAKDVLHPEFTGIRTSSSRILSGDYQKLGQKSSQVWLETADLASNCWIATESGWEKVKVVYKVAHETVWDIRVSKNHNFVGNGLVAHNCMLATANNTGLTKIANIMSNDTSYDYSDVTSNAYNRVKLGENYLSGTGAVGDMYALNSTNNALERWNNVVADAASETNGTPDATVNATSTPALFASAQTVNDLDLKTGTSLANSGNNTVFVGHNGGITVFQENRATLASSSVKYYTKDYIGEEMVGDIRGVWPLSSNGTLSLSDISLKGNTLTNNSSVTAITGVRGAGASFSGSNYMSNSSTNGTSLSGSSTGSIGFWIKFPSGNTSRADIISSNTAVANWGGYYLDINASAGKIYWAPQTSTGYVCTLNSTTSVNDGLWHFITTVVDGSNCKIYTDGQSDGSTAQSGSIGYSASANTNIQIGAYANPGPTNYLPSTTRIDDLFVTATALTATQIQQMYIAGKEALNNKYRVKLASDTVNQLAGSINVVKGVAASDQYIFAGTNTTGADDGILSRVLLRGDVTDKTYDESATDPLIVDNDINSVAVSKDGAYIIVGTDDQGITIIHNGSAANRLRSGGKVQGPSKRPSN